jgi:hypothetical protein
MVPFVFTRYRIFQTWELKRSIKIMGYWLTLLGETRVLSVDSVFSLNTIHTPPVSGALGEIGL